LRHPTYDHGVQQITHHGKVLGSFTDQELDKLQGNWGIGHVSLKERQPAKSPCPSAAMSSTPRR
jgi:amidophosphoribosyltransferase